jgi:hypothetical protein
VRREERGLARLVRALHQADDPVRVRLDGWIASLRAHTRNRSDASLRSVMLFYLNQCLPRAGLELSSWPADAGATLATHLQTPGAVVAMCGESRSRHRKFGWLEPAGAT